MSQYHTPEFELESGLPNPLPDQALLEARNFPTTEPDYQAQIPNPDALDQDLETHRDNLEAIEQFKLELSPKIGETLSPSSESSLDFKKKIDQQGTMKFEPLGIKEEPSQEASPIRPMSPGNFLPDKNPTENAGIEHSEGTFNPEPKMIKNSKTPDVDGRSFEGMLDEELIIKHDRSPNQSDLSESQEKKPKKNRDSTSVRVDCSRGSKADAKKHLLHALVEHKSMTVTLNENLRIQDASNKAFYMLGSGKSTMRKKFDPFSSTSQQDCSITFHQQVRHLQDRLFNDQADQEYLEKETNKSFKK